MTYTVDGLIEEMMRSLPADYVIQSKDDALIKAAFTAEELGEVVKAISQDHNREVVKECADAIIGLLQIMAFYNGRDEQGVTSAFDNTLKKLKARKIAGNRDRL